MRRVLGAIDVGSNAVRLVIARVGPAGTIQVLARERDGLRPGQGVWAGGAMPRRVVDRLIDTLRRYGARCRRHGAAVRAVATSALRDAVNREDIVKRAREEAGVDLEVVSGVEEARLICLGVVAGAPRARQHLVVDVGGGSTEIALAAGEKPEQMWSVDLGAVRLMQMFKATDVITPRTLRLMRAFAAEHAARTLPARLAGAPRTALGSSGTIAAVVAVASGGYSEASLAQIVASTEKLAAGDADRRASLVGTRRADIVVPGSVIVEAVLQRLGVRAIQAVDRGLRDGVLVDLARGGGAIEHEDVAVEGALALGRRFGFDEAHARQVARLAGGLFDDLARVHRLPHAARAWLEVAALLHDVGHAVSREKHHRHGEYIVRHADLAGLTEGERELVARVVRWHRRDPPEDELESDAVRKLSAIVRVADSLDFGGRRAVASARAKLERGVVVVSVGANAPVDLELWDLRREAPRFERALGRGLEVRVRRARGA